MKDVVLIADSFHGVLDHVRLILVAIVDNERVHHAENESRGENFKEPASELMTRIFLGLKLLLN